MNTNLEDHLRRLTDPVAAPPTDRAREAITHRKQVLHRRHQTRTAALGGMFVVLVVAGILALQRDPAEDQIPAGPDDDGVALTVEGNEVIGSQDYTQDPDEIAQESLQVFGRADDPDGPAIYVRNYEVSDPPGDHGPEYESVPLDGTTGYLEQFGKDSYRLEWRPTSTTDSGATIEAWGVPKDEVIDFARRLIPKDKELHMPSTKGDMFGFDAEYVPAGLSEQPPTRPSRDALHYRIVSLKVAGDADGLIGIESLNVGKGGFEKAVRSAKLSKGVTTEDLELAGRHAVLFHRASDASGWQIEVAVTDTVKAQIYISAVDDRAVVDANLAKLKLLNVSEWQELRAAYPEP
jgi:hypothetical protein